jgi:hypothetical protein
MWNWMKSLALHHYINSDPRDLKSWWNYGTETLRPLSLMFFERFFETLQMKTKSFQWKNFFQGANWIQRLFTSNSKEFETFFNCIQTKVYCKKQVIPSLNMNLSLSFRKKINNVWSIKELFPFRKCKNSGFTWSYLTYGFTYEIKKLYFQ